MSARFWIAHLGLTTKVFRGRGRLNIPLVLGIAAVGVFQIAAVIFASFLDGTWYLCGTGRGLFQHYGAWAILVTDPFALIATGYAYCRFRSAILTMPVCSPSDNFRRYRDVLKPFLQLVKARGNGRHFFALLLIFGILSWLNNIRQTIDPYPYYRHDVFDSFPHIYGFIAYKICMFISWVVIYPAAGYELLAMSLSTWLILSRSRQRQLICPHVLHPDNCYGLKNFGTLNIALFVPFLLAYVVMFALMATHGAFYEPILIPLAGMSAVVLIISYIIITPAYWLLKEARLNVFDDLLRRTRAAPFRDEHDVMRFVLDRMSFVSADSSPYSAGTRLMMTAMRLIPITTFIVNLLAQQFVQASR